MVRPGVPPPPPCPLGWRGLSSAPHQAVVAVLSFSLNQRGVRRAYALRSQPRGGLSFAHGESATQGRHQESHRRSVANPSKHEEARDTRRPQWTSSWISPWPLARADACFLLLTRMPTPALRIHRSRPGHIHAVGEFFLLHSKGAARSHSRQSVAPFFETDAKQMPPAMPKASQQRRQWQGMASWGVVASVDGGGINIKRGQRINVVVVGEVKSGQIDLRSFVRRDLEIQKAHTRRRPTHTQARSKSRSSRRASGPSISIQSRSSDRV